MRLTDEQVCELRRAVQRRFGAHARLWLFGSRIDDAARGGDYDLLVQTGEGDAERLVDAKLGFLCDLHATPAFDGERIDVVLHSLALTPQPDALRAAALERGIEIT